MYNSSILRQYLIIQKLKPKIQELPGASLLALAAYFEYTKKNPSYASGWGSYMYSQKPILIEGE